MKATIIGTDLLEQNGEVKILETNTNTTIFNDGADLLDYTDLFNMLVNNSITEFHFVWTEVDSYKPLNQQFKFKKILEEKCLENNITFSEYIVPVNSITIPYIEDAPNKFVLRQSYDTTALVDETYCADKFEFFNLMSGSNYIPKTYFVDGELGMDGVDTFTDNGSNPNILIKARYPQYDSLLYPELHVLSTNEQLNTLKTDLPINHLMQEFIFDDVNLVEGRYSIIRSIDILYGSELDIINMGGYKQSAYIPLSFTETEFVDSTTKLNQKSRTKYITKQLGNSRGIDYHADDDSVILDYTGSLKDVDTIKLGDYIRSINFQDTHGFNAAAFDENVTTYGWDSTLELSNQTLTQMSSSLQSILSSSVDTIFIKVTLEDGKTWVDSPSANYYIEESGSLATRFEKLNKMYVGDKLIVTDSNTNELRKIEITGLEMEHAQKTIYSIDFEPSDLFLVDVGDGDFSVMHNPCWCPWVYCGYWCNADWCDACRGGGPNK